MKLDNERTDALLKEYGDQRDALKLMIADLEKIKVKIDILFPERFDARYAKFFEEKMKSISALFQILLEIRKEILKSVKDELEVRKKVDIEKELEDSIENIRDLAKRVEKYQKDQKVILEEQNSVEKPLALLEVNS